MPDPHSPDGGASPHTNPLPRSPHNPRHPQNGSQYGRPNPGIRVVRTHGLIFHGPILMGAKGNLPSYTELERRCQLLGIPVDSPAPFNYDELSRLGFAFAAKALKRYGYKWPSLLYLPWLGSAEPNNLENLR